MITFNTPSNLQLVCIHYRLQVVPCLSCHALVPTSYPLCIVYHPCPIAHSVLALAWHYICVVVNVSCISGDAHVLSIRVHSAGLRITAAMGIYVISVSSLHFFRPVFTVTHCLVVALYPSS